jgi:hypothetical protein
VPFAVVVEAAVAAAVAAMVLAAAILHLRGCMILRRSGAPI